MRRAAIALAAVALAAGGCGGGDGDDGGDPPGHGELAFFRTAETDYELARARDDGRGPRVLAGASIDGSVVPHIFARPAWSPDGRRIAFAGVASGDPGGFSADVYVMDAGGGHQRRLTRTRDAVAPDWSPDGRTILFTRFHRDDTPTGSLWSMRADGSGLRRLTAPRSGQNDRGGTFARDGSLIAFTRMECPGLRCRSEIRTVRPDGTGERRFIDRASDPAFSPDGRRIAYASERDRNGLLSYGEREHVAGELYVAAADGTRPRRLTRTRDLNEASPAWSPDGERLAFQRGVVTGNAEAMSIHQVNPDGSCAAGPGRQGRSRPGTPARRGGRPAAAAPARSTAELCLFCRELTLYRYFGQTYIDLLVWILERARA